MGRPDTNGNGNGNAMASPQEINVIMPPENKKGSITGIITAVLSLLTLLVTIILVVLTLGASSDTTEPQEIDLQVTTAKERLIVSAMGVPLSTEPGGAFSQNNPCEGAKPIHADPVAEDEYFKNTPCKDEFTSVLNVLEQAGANVTKGYRGEIEALEGNRIPITEPYWKEGLCPVNVHWHLGAEHLSVGEYDEDGKGPSYDVHRKMLAYADTRQGFQCHHYDSSDAKFTTEYDWKHCVGMEVGQTYEVHWPHSAAGACGTVDQYQTPFYDGVFCTPGVISLSPLNTFKKIGVQSQVYTIVNDETYYYPDLMRGMIVQGDYGKDIAKYTGSTTGTSRDNEICSRYTPITWQVDRECHLISASSFDKLCADMKAQRDDMSSDLHAHGSRELVADHLAANNQMDK